LKILVLDIETAPNLAYVWGMWDQNVSIKQLVRPTYMLCWTAKWVGEDKIFQNREKTKLKDLWNLLNEADAVLHYNGKKFDIPHINREFLEKGYKPPSPYKQIDLLDTVKRIFKFPSNKLDYVSRSLRLNLKSDPGGFDTWIGCIKDDDKAWNTMLEYNKQDIIVTEQLYNKIKGWIPNHANHSIHGTVNDSLVCPNCGSTHYQKRGKYRAVSSQYQRYRCKPCGKWFRDNKILNRKQYRTVGVQ